EYEENPPVAIVFWSFRFMVGLGFLFIGLALWGGYLIYNGRLSESSRFLKTMIAASPLGYAALLTGWYVTEIGRQPWVIQGELRTSEAVSSTLSGTEATLTLVGFVVIYIGLILVALHVLRWLVEDELSELGVRASDDDRWYGPVPKVSDDD
ncbi:cytochrome ubiquinol oxidase subunit I, partial [Halorubrum ezzemoulense]